MVTKIRIRNQYHSEYGRLRIFMIIKAMLLKRYADVKFVLDIAM